MAPDAANPRGYAACVADIRQSPYGGLIQDSVSYSEILWVDMSQAVPAVPSRENPPRFKRGSIACKRYELASPVLFPARHGMDSQRRDDVALGLEVVQFDILPRPFQPVASMSALKALWDNMSTS